MGLLATKNCGHLKYFSRKNMEPIRKFETILVAINSEISTFIHVEMNGFS